MSDSHNLSSLTRKLITSTRLASPPHHATFPDLTAIIADLQLHPTIEAILHMLNSDLTSAHFLVRHMQAPPAVEGMLLHGILHRAEGDFNNARAWFGDVRDACDGFKPKKRDEGEKLEDDVFEKTKSPKQSNETLFSYVYEDEGDANALIDDVEAFRKQKKGDKEGLEERGRRELEKVLEWCKGKFGEEPWKDATKAWVKNSEEISKISGDMVSGGKGHREF
ncbi:hypothetical protein HBI56_016750 [Parastagonospora nodorum]|uniref:Uncharacterized protein n=1 Tax=Phaeosphaeria nodorum (strain SN15 / ATCC MYA-4574 / FGSC 10173) TaxID=321614 RepID=A0A7U2HYL3_PHANO|nr:hypothetical protein HBH56_083250 [Parastagonospora nodorum]QRC96720.1 hypothetical protein JI435_016130 [Parastagonospora nodorum SN15]KAH3929754.1 hypothetical protein HBH54_118580 [Parastagonospora nodorum]KAH3955793.1 hypothetical protein HBH53_005980 [Parastagonospora nodorum]KAH3977068.1 hypothetical protein HBH51_075530 [Parastagonospora nodorum]